MPPHKHRLHKLRQSVAFESVFVGLAVASIILLGYELLVELPSKETVLLGRIDLLIAGLFLADYGLGLWVAANKKRYIRANWYILLASIPVNEYIFRFLRVLRALRMMRLGRLLSQLAFTSTWYKRHRRRNKP